MIDEARYNLDPGLAWQLVWETGAERAYLVRDRDAISRNLGEAGSHGWTDLKWIHFEDYENPEGRGLVIYRLGSKDVVDCIQMLAIKWTLEPWPSVCHMYSNAAELEADCTRRTGIEFLNA